MSLLVEEPNKTEERLAILRARIDRIDGVLAALLSERARIALELAEIKQDLGQQMRSPAREAAVLRRVARLAVGPLDHSAMVRIFSVIIEETRAAQRLVLHASAEGDGQRGDEHG